MTMLVPTQSSKTPEEEVYSSSPLSALPVSVGDGYIDVADRSICTKSVVAIKRVLDFRASVFFMRTDSSIREDFDRQLVHITPHRVTFVSSKLMKFLSVISF